MWTSSSRFKKGGPLFLCFLLADHSSKKRDAFSGMSKLWCSISRIWGAIVSGSKGPVPPELSLLRESSGTGISILPFLRQIYLILPCSVSLEGKYGINDFFIGVSVKWRAHEVGEIVEINLNNKEKRALYDSARAVHGVLKRIKSWDDRGGHAFASKKVSLTFLGGELLGRKCPS
jgi:hypothetical protein